ncbi:MAG: hypothetical protein ACXVCY_18485 [Pseudobdellovibrionaceae bacterium]
MKNIILTFALIIGVSNGASADCYVQETSDHYYLVISEDGPTLGVFSTLSEATAHLQKVCGSNL